MDLQIVVQVEESACNETASVYICICFPFQNFFCIAFTLITYFFFEVKDLLHNCSSLIIGI